MKILYVEGHSNDAAQIRSELVRQLQSAYMDSVPTLNAAITRLQQTESYDLVLADLHLPDGSGLDLLAHIRKWGLPLAVIILIDLGEEASAMTALKAGANAYLVKQAGYLSRLPVAIKGILDRLRSEASHQTRILRVLYAEPDAAVIELTRRHLTYYAPPLQLELARTAAEVLQHLALPNTAPAACDILLLNSHLPDRSALELLKVLHDEGDLNIPIILLTEQGDEELAVQTLHLGVTDYLIKQPGYLFQLSRLLEKACHCIEAALEQFVPDEPEALFRVLLEASSDLIALLNADGSCAFASAAAATLLGYSPAKLLGRPLLDVIHPDDQPKWVWAFEEILYSSQPVLFEVRAQRPDAGWRTLEIVARNRLDHPSIRGIVANIRDVTLCRRVEEKLRQLFTVFDSMRDGVIITDATGHLIAVNRAFSEITAYTEAEVLGKNPRFLQSGRHDVFFYRALWSSLQQTGHWHGEIWNQRKSGEIYPQWLTISDVRDTQGHVKNYVGVFSDISDLKHSEAQLEHLAYYDHLTGLPNRLLLYSRLDHALEWARRDRDRLALLFLDLDRFKNINDSLGHPSGDELLKAIAQRLRRRLREMDTLARLGGDEFLLLLEHLEQPEDAAAVAQAIIQLLENPFFLQGGQEVYIGVSIGISLFPDDGQDPTQLVRNADTAMYQAKEYGRNTYRFYTEALTWAANERLELEAKLRHALERREFVLHYQPQIDIFSGNIVGVEALLRWQHPEEGMIPPGRFIPLAEETGIIVPIGDWVLRTACTQARAWLEANLPPLTLAVNLSTRQFLHRGLVEYIGTILTESALPPTCLELEITESALMAQGREAETTLRALKDLGLQLSIDDFGTGYSSLAYLKRFAIDKLKIDQSFVRDIPYDVNDQAIATTIIAMARNLRLRVLAEGVETVAQLEFLRDRGCDAYQGYLFSRPLPADKLLVLLRSLQGRPGRIPTNKALPYSGEW